MNNMPNYPDVDAEIPPNAVRVIDNATEDFPILKAFQSYVDAEQSKARKRMLALSIFFGVLLTIVVGVFIIILHDARGQNQRLNDRLIEYVMKEHERQAAVAAQVQTSKVDNSSILAKMEEIQKKMERDEAERKAAAEEAAKKAAELAAAPKGPTPEEIEIERLKALLAAERQKAEDDREKRRQEELEAYRRKHYPELYETPKKVRQKPSVKDEALDKILDDLDDDDAISYFDEPQSPKPSAAPSPAPSPAPSAPAYTIPVEVNGVSGSWRIPE